MLARPAGRAESIQKKRTPFALVKQIHWKSSSRSSASASAPDPCALSRGRSVEHFGAELAQPRTKPVLRKAFFGPGDDDALSEQRALIEPRDLIANHDGPANDDDHRRSDALGLHGVGERFQRRHDRSLAGVCSPLDRRGGNLGRQASRNERPGMRGSVRTPM